jgi:hypothetical protein
VTVPAAIVVVVLWLVGIAATYHWRRAVVRELVRIRRALERDRRRD